MKIPKIVNDMEYIDDDLIIGTAESRTKSNRLWVKIGAAAACFALIILAGASVLPSLFGKNGVNPTVPSGRYKNFNVRADEISAIAWPWEYKTVYEKYTQVEINGVEYLGQGRALSAESVGKCIGKFKFIGYDITDGNKKYTAEFEAYTLQNVAQNQFIAVKMEDSYYIFKNSEYAPPATLGELMKAVNLSENVKLSRFSENGDNPDSRHFILNSDAYIWEVLSDYGSAVFVENPNWTVSGRNYISFTVTSETLGIYKTAMYVTEDGYLWTNAFSWQYLFEIGEDAAGKIIRYAKENSRETEYEPYRNTVVGTVTEITENCILLNDSVLCKNPSDGITYRILLDDIRISRYVKYGKITVGDTVQIAYEGEIDKSNANTVSNAVSISKAVITDADVLIQE